MNTRILLLKLILLAVLIFTDNPVFSQGNFEVSGGLGSPEPMSLRIKYGKNIQIALCQSFGTRDFVGPIAIEVYYHFSGKSRYVEQPTWYLLCGFGYFWGGKSDNPFVISIQDLEGPLTFQKELELTLMREPLYLFLILMITIFSHQ